MIVVRVELHSAITGVCTELARMHICNDVKASTENRNFGDYDVRTLRGRDRAALDKNTPHREGKVLHHARLRLHVWYLVAKALKAVGYLEP